MKPVHHLKLLMLFMAAVLIVGSAPMHAQVATTSQINLWRQQIRRALFIPDPLPDPLPESYGTITAAPGVILEHVSYRTAYNLRVPADVYRPSNPPKGKMPALVVVNGHGVLVLHRRALRPRGCSGRHLRPHRRGRT
jgi:hypothetical protein